MIASLTCRYGKELATAYADFRANADQRRRVRSQEEAGAVCNVLSRSDVEELGPGVVFHDKDVGIGQVVDRKEFPPCSPSSPYSHCWCAGLLGFVQTRINAAGTWLCSG